MRTCACRRSFEYGRSLVQWVDPTDTNKLANLEMATQVFGRICDQSPTNRLAIPAWLERGNCYLQWALARQQFDSLTNALNAYQQVIGSLQADVAARSEAKLGQAIVFEKWAEQKTGAARDTLLKQALSNCLDVVYGNILRENEELRSFAHEGGRRQGLPPRRVVAGLAAVGEPL